MSNKSPPARRPPAASFSAGASSTAPPPRRRGVRALRGLGWLVLALVTVVLVAGAGVWWWAGSNTSLALALARAAQYLPAEQQLESRDVTGSLRSGGRIGWLRWSSPTLAVEVTDIRLGWQLAPLLQRRLELGEVHAARVHVIPQGPPRTEPAPALEPLTELVLPLQIGVPFRVDEIQWDGPPAVQARDLAGDYRFDGRQHRLNIDGVALAQGRYSARIALDAHAPMALDATVDGTVHTAVPGGGADLQLAAHATLQGTLATAAAQLQLNGHIAPASSTDPGTDGSGAAPAPMQADVQATLAPWQKQPLQSATAALRSVNLAALWPQAPVTALHGTVQAGPTGTATAPGAPNRPHPSNPSNPPSEGDAGWSIHTELRNDLPGPWDQARLPLGALTATATYDGNRWTVPHAVASTVAGTGVVKKDGKDKRTDLDAGTATLQGHYTPATGAVDGQAELRAVSPAALHTALAAAPLSGRISARTDGTAVRFQADIQAANTRATGAGRPDALRINTFSTQGRWQAADKPDETGKPDASGGTVLLERLLLDAQQARLEATQLRVDLGAQSAQGQLALTLPGATARAKGQIAARTGAGELQVQWSDIDRTQRWLNTLPLVGAQVQRALKGAAAKGSAQVTAQWKGGWQTAMEQLQAALSAKPLPAGATPFALQATLDTPQLDLTLPPAVGSGGGSGTGATSSAMALQTLQLRGVKAELAGSLAQATLALRGEGRTGPPVGNAPYTLRADLQTRLSGGLTAAGQWQAQISELRLQAQDTRRPGPWSLQLAEPLTLKARAPGPGAVAVDASAGQAKLTGPQPGTVNLRWQPVRVTTGAGTPLALQTQGTLQGLPMAWLDALESSAAPGTASSAAQPLLARLGLASTLVLDGQWNVDTTTTLRASARLQRASGDLRILAGDATAVTAVQSSGQGVGTGAATAIATQASDKGAASNAGTAAGVRQAEITVQAEGDALSARLLWASDRAGEVDASASTRLTITRASNTTPGSITLAANAPLAGTVRARLPDVGVWSALAPPGWRVRGTLDANATLSGTLDAPRWSGTLGADDMAVRSVVDGVDLQGGRLRATLKGNQLDITELRLQGGRGSGARIAGFSGNRTAAPQDGGTLTGTGRITWGEAGNGLSGITMALQAEAKALQVLGRADRQISVSGQLQAQLQQGQISLRGKLTTDRATLILPDETAPSLGSDVVVRSAAKDRADQAKVLAAAKANQAVGQVEAAKPPDIAITLNLGRDFALQGHGITTRLTGEIDIRSSAVPGAPPRVTGEVRTQEGRYRAWGQMLDVETGLIRFNGPYNNPSLDILALRPNIAVRAGVQVTGSAQAPRVKLYSDPELPDAEKLSWVVLGRDAAAGGAEAAVLQQAALALLGSKGGNGTANVASRLGLDEIGFKGPGTGEDASAAALTFGKRLSKDLYVTYERSLSGTLGTLYIFYDLSRRLTLRGQTGEKSAVDLIYTMTYN